MGSIRCASDRPARASEKPTSSTPCHASAITSGTGSGKRKVSVPPSLTEGHELRLDAVHPRREEGLHAREDGQRR